MSYHCPNFCDILYHILLSPTLFNIVCVPVSHGLGYVCIVVFNHNVINLYSTAS